VEYGHGVFLKRMLMTHNQPPTLSRIVSETVALQARFQLAVTPSLSAAAQHAACTLASERSTNLRRKWRDTFIRERRF
jgi:hypothetical protein